MSNEPYLEQPQLHTKAEHRAALLTYPGNLRGAVRQAKENPKKILFGLGQGIPSVFATKVYASTKPDFIWMDVEHGIYDRSTLYDAVQAAQHHSEGKTMVIVRVPKHDEISLSTALDAGAAGIIFPHMESGEDVKEMIKKVYYPPVGERSFSPWTFTPGISDASLYEKDSFNMKSSNSHVAIIPQIESVKGIENIEEIAAVPEVTMLMFGPGDFMADAGIELKMGGEPDPRFLAAMGKFIGAAKKYGKPLFGHAMQQDMIPMLVEQGYAAIGVIFDMWGFAGVINDKLKEGRAYVEMGNEPEGRDDGEKEVISGKPSHS